MHVAALHTPAWCSGAGTASTSEWSHRPLTTHPRCHDRSLHVHTAALHLHCSVRAQPASQQPRRRGRRLGWRLRAADDAGGAEASLHLGCFNISYDKKQQAHALLAHTAFAAVCGSSTGMRLTQAPLAAK